MKTQIPPLIRLAWAALPERPLICRIANDLLRDGMRPPFGVEKQETAQKGVYQKKAPANYHQQEAQKRIRAVVRASVPPRGGIRKRERAVTEEMGRQYEIREKRAKLQGYSSLRGDKYNRMSVVARRIFGLNDAGIRQKYECRDFCKVDGHLYVYVKSGLTSAVHVRHPSGATSAFLVGSNRFKIHEAVAEMVSCVLPREVILSGRPLRIDLCRASVWADGVEYPFSGDGPINTCEPPAASR